MGRIFINELVAREEKMVIQEVLHLIQSWQGRLEEKAERRAVGVKVRKTAKRLGYKKMKKNDRIQKLEGDLDKTISLVIVGYIIDFLLILFLILKG
jgi:hypothetical protein